jgi:hypothetical protein
MNKDLVENFHSRLLHENIRTVENVLCKLKNALTFCHIVHASLAEIDVILGGVMAEV